jgi:hypothetical protein
MSYKLIFKYDTLSCRTKPRPQKGQSGKAVQLDTCASCASGENVITHKHECSQLFGQNVFS